MTTPRAAVNTFEGEVGIKIHRDYFSRVDLDAHTQFQR